MSIEKNSSTRKVHRCHVLGNTRVQNTSLLLVPVCMLSSLATCSLLPENRCRKPSRGPFQRLVILGIPTQLSLPERVVGVVRSRGIRKYPRTSISFMASLFYPVVIPSHETGDAKNPLSVTAQSCLIEVSAVKAGFCRASVSSVCQPLVMPLAPRHNP